MDINSNSKEIMGKINKSKKSNTAVNIPSIGKIKAFFESMTQEDFNNKIVSLVETEEDEKLQSFFYYIILFRDLENVQYCLNSKSVPVKFIEKLFMFTCGHCAMHGYTTESVLDSMLFFLSNERLLELLQESQLIKSDKLLMFFILARLNLYSLDTYFSKHENLIDIISVFYKLPEEMMKSIIAKNHQLFEYIMMMLMKNPVAKDKAKIFILKYREIIEQFNDMSNIVSKYHTNVDLTSEGILPFEKRDMGRISYLVNTLRSLPDREKAVEYFTESKVFVDDNERQIVSALVSDPFFKNIFQKEDIQKFRFK